MTVYDLPLVVFSEKGYALHTSGAQSHELLELAVRRSLTAHRAAEPREFHDGN